MIPDRSSLRETARHGSADFPLAVYRSRPNRNREILFPHWHDEVELLLLLSGEADFSLDGEPVRLVAGEGVLIGSGVLHQADSEAHDACSFLAIVFDLRWLGALMEPALRERHLPPLLTGLGGPPVLLGQEDAPIQSALRERAADWLDAKPGAGARLTGLLLEGFGALAAQGRLPSGADDLDGMDRQKRLRIRQAVRFIQEHAGERIGIEEMAGHVHLSRFHFCRLFRSATGRTPLEYLTAWRIRLAETLLADEDLKVMEVALDAGFENVSWFISCFRRANGCTPAEYRKRASAMRRPEQWGG